MVPGCRHGTFVDIHHLNPREEGGAHEDDNLITLCAAHHRALHLGKLAIAGSPSKVLVFRHADGTIYGSTPDAARTDVASKVFSALVGQGFSEKQARNALARVSADHPEARTCEQVLRAALRCLTEKPGRAA